MFSTKEQTVNVLGSADHGVPVTTTLLCHCSSKAARNNTNECGWAPTKLFTKKKAAGGR
jgi:hypothetical protein